jgi:hypothetical protein
MRRAVTSMAFGAAAVAADLPKEGTFTGTFPAAGTAKVYPVGKEQATVQWDANGLTVGTGVLDHMTWHCFGGLDATSGISQWSGRCVATDPAGDQIVSNWTSDKYAADGKTYLATGTFATGSGKYAGISGSIAATCESPIAYKTADPANYVFNANLQARYKLP